MCTAYSVYYGIDSLYRSEWSKLHRAFDVPILVYIHDVLYVCHTLAVAWPGSTVSAAAINVYESCEGCE